MGTFSCKFNLILYLSHITITKYRLSFEVTSLYVLLKNSSYCLFFNRMKDFQLLLKHFRKLCQDKIYLFSL